MNKFINNEYWYQLSFEDDNCLSGESVYQFLGLLSNIFKIDNVILEDVVGTFDSGKFPDGKSLSLIEFKSEIKDVVQFDWAFLFINCSEFNDDTDKIEDNFNNSEVVIRLADDTYFYIYSKNELNIKKLISGSIELEFRHCLFGDLEILY